MTQAFGKLQQHSSYWERFVIWSTYLYLWKPKVYYRVYKSPKLETVSWATEELISLSLQLKEQVTSASLVWCHKSGECAMSCARVYISVFLKSERWTCQYSFVYIAVATMLLRQEGRRLCETRAHGPHAKWRGLCWYNPATPSSSLHALFRLLCNTIFISTFRLCKLPSVQSFRVLFLCVIYLMATGNGVESPVFESQQRQKIFFLPELQSSAVRPTHSPTQWVPDLFPWWRAAGSGSWPLTCI
jgi:hypothetical protein